MIIFDVDGVLADPYHRLRHISGDEKDWEKFFLDSINDPVIPAGFLTFSRFKWATGLDIKLWTGRDEQYEHILRIWLEQHGFSDAKRQPIRMRPHGDHCPDVELKGRWVEEVGPENIRLVFEDRKRVVDMYRSYGIPCYQTAAGDF